jgi:sensor domain CHASE-containing protein
MRMRGKVIAILGLLIAAVLLARQFIASTVILPKFLALEQQKGQRDIHRVQMALAMNLEEMARNVEDYAQWDEMYAFARSRNPAFTQASLSPRVFDHLRLNCIFIYGADGEKIWAQTRDYRTTELLRIPDLPEGEFAHWDARFRRPDSPVVLSGFLTCGKQVMYAASSPILTSHGAGPPRGHVVFGRLLLPGEQEQLARQVHVKFSLRGDLPESVAGREKTAPQESEILFDPASENQLDVYLPLKGLGGATIRWIAAGIPRQISAEGRQALRLSGYTIGMTGFLILAAAYWCFGRFVVKPVEKLTRHVQWIRQSGDLTNRLNIHRTDEVGILATEFDLLLTSVAKDRALRRRYEQRLRGLLQEQAATGRNAPASSPEISPVPPLSCDQSPETFDAPPALPLS